MIDNQHFLYWSIYLHMHDDYRTDVRLL